LPLPTWVLLSDVVSALCLWVAAAAWASGGFRLFIGPLPFSVRAPTVPLVFGVLLLVVRHARFPRPHVISRVRASLLRLTASDAWKAAWGPFVATRVCVLLVGLFAVYAVGFPPGEPRVRTSENELVNLPMRWDAGWYMAVARFGYYWDRRATRQQNIPFFPAYPMLVRGVARMWGDTEPLYLATAVAVSHVAFLWSLLLLYQLARSELGTDEAARSAVLLLACYPFSIFHAAVYTESLYLLAVIGAVLALRTERWVRACAWGLLVGLTRPNGFLLSATLALLAWPGLLAAFRRRGVRTLVSTGAAVMAPVLGVVLYSWYIGVRTGHPLQWWTEHAAWGRTFKGLPFADAVDFVRGHGLQDYVAALPYDVLNGVAALWALLLVVPVGMRFGPAYAVFIALTVLPPLLLGGTMSLGRMTSTLFPLFLWLAARPGYSTATLAAAFALLQGLAAVLFYTWRPLF
jgi:hypothetical protein